MRDLEAQKMSLETVRQTADTDLDVVRKMALRDGDDAIARVLNTLARRTRSGNP
jgi:hypothetical protein